MRTFTALKCLMLSVISFLFFSSTVLANNLSISNVSLGNRNISAKTVAVNFDISWQNSWRTKINHDAVWLTVRLYNPSSNPTAKKLCQISASGLAPAGSSVGTNSNLEFYVPSDKLGAFLRPASYGMTPTSTSSNVSLTVDYSSCGFADTETVYASVFGIEMVFIPEGSFYAGDYDQSAASLDQGSSDTSPWLITSESAINTGNPASSGYRYVSAGQSSEDATGASFTIPQDFPKGYKPFYVMKYEVSEADWVEFINSLPSDAARSARDLTDGNHKNSDAVKLRNTINCSGTPLTCVTNRPARSLGYLSWMDLTAFLDWAALRPITELEFEKAARGPVLAVSGEFAWGSTNVSAATTISSGTESGAETVESTANANFNNTTFTGGDSSNGADFAQGPLRAGIFALSSPSRENSGASYYGVMELSGNVREHVVTIGNAVGRQFTGVHGNGVLSSASGFVGNADEVNWPGLDAVIAHGVTTADGSGFRGGAFDQTSNTLRVSDRSDAANASMAAYGDAGGRGARTYDGN